jgi:acyl carrier protein
MTADEQTEFLTNLEEALESDAGTLKMETNLADLPNWDSMAVLSFMAMMDASYGVTIAPAKLADCATVADLAALKG